MSRVGNTERLILGVQVLRQGVTYATQDNFVSQEISVDAFIDTVAPILVHSSPAAGETVSQDYLTLALLDLPSESGSGINRGTLSVWIDSKPYFRSGTPNSEYCKAELHGFSTTPKIIITLFYEHQLAVGEHEVRVYVEDNNGNALDTSFTFNQAYVLAESDSVILEDRKRTNLLWDIDWFRKCDHKLVRERHFVEPDLQTVRLNRTLVRNSELRVYINGVEIAQDDPRRGFEILPDPRSVEPYQKHLLYFKYPFRSNTDLVEVTYTTMQTTCPKCHSQGRIYDMNVQDNFFKKAILETKLVQEVTKIVLTVAGSNPRYPWYGTSISALIGEKGGGSPLVAARIQREVYAALEALRDLKIQQRQLQEVPPEEFIEEVVEVKVNVDEADPTKINVHSTLRVESGRFVETMTLLPFIESQLVAV